MANKELMTRIALKYDLYSNWTTNNPKLLAGEVALAYIPTDASATTGNHTVTGTTPPQVLIKVGDGTNKYNDLKFVSALAADVNSYSKLSVADFETQIKTLASAQLSADIEANTDAIEALQGLVGGTAVETQIANAIAALDLANTYAAKSHTHTASEITDLDATVKAYDYATKAEAQGYADAKDEAIAAAKKAGDDAQTDVDILEGNVGSVDGLSTTNKTVVGAINEVLAAVGTGGTAAVVTVEKSTDGLTYTIKQGEATVGTIDIPKDMVVIAGEVVTNPEGQAEGTYIKLTLANVTDPLYINVGTLVDIYKAQDSAAQVQIAIDSATREISATIVAGSVTSTELADNAVITAKIADANVTKAKLSAEVQASLDLADSAIQEDDLADLKTASHSHTFVESELNKIVDGDVAKWNAAEQNAKDYADGLAGNYATAAQGAKADTAIQTVAAGTGLEVTVDETDSTKLTVDIDDTVVFVFNCGNSAIDTDTEFTA